MKLSAQKEILPSARRVNRSITMRWTARNSHHLMWYTFVVSCSSWLRNALRARVSALYTIGMYSSIFFTFRALCRNSSTLPRQSFEIGYRNRFSSSADKAGSELAPPGPGPDISVAPAAPVVPSCSSAAVWAPPPVPPGPPEGPLGLFPPSSPPVVFCSSAWAFCFFSRFSAAAAFQIQYRSSSSLSVSTASGPLGSTCGVRRESPGTYGSSRRKTEACTQSGCREHNLEKAFTRIFGLGSSGSAIFV
mmetsp:Transcript_20025/g.50500  ORF Transcript_20025/g.50500 Transcript_20025/m.50500 type:complete len:248 (+) Transcript_20025:1740-2483(+)